MLQVSLTAFGVIGYTPFTDDDAQSLVAPFIDHAVEEIGNTLLVLFRHLAILLVGIAPEIILTVAAIVIRCIVMELNTHVVVAVAVYVLGNDEITVIDTEIRIADIGLN